MSGKKNRFWGAVLLVAGTTIGAGMLALPVTTGTAGFVPSLLLMTLMFLFMMLTALYLLEVNLRIKGESNIISMVRKTLGKPYEVVAWISYLLLLYSLTAAYLVGCTQILDDFLAPYTLPFGAGQIIIFIIFSFFVYFGTHIADLFNRFLMGGLIGSYLILISLGLPHIDLKLLSFHSFPCLLTALPVIATSFGYHIIIPTLTEYLSHDTALLKRAILIGSLIPFIVYILWQFLAMGVIPLEGECSLTKAQELGLQATFFLKEIIGHPLIGIAARLFGFFAIVTSLLGVGLSLSDFLSDGLKIKKSPLGKLSSVLLAFSPPLLFALFFQKGFITALQYAGIFAVILLALFPTLMAWGERYRKKGFVQSEFKVFGGKPLLLSSIIFSLILIALEIFL